MAILRPITWHVVRLPALSGLLLLAATGCREDPTSPPANNPSTPAALATSATPLSFEQLSAMWNTCGVTTGGKVYCWGRVPSPRAAGLQFLQVREGVDFACGLTTTNRVYCWGFNTVGQLGNGSNQSASEVPVELAGGRRYRQVRVGDSHGCATTISGVSYCWGLNADGQLGDGTTINRRAPVKVAGGHTFVVVSTGGFHTCGLSVSRKAYCWGLNRNGQLGIRNSTTQLKPVAVSDGRTFKVVAAGGLHTCAVAPDGKGYCWGLNSNGQLGDGTTSRRSRPTLVAGGLTFSGISPGSGHTCGLTPSHKAFCWGYNYYGSVGDGTSGSTPPFTFRRFSPTAVVGGLLFDKITAGSTNSCGVTLSHRAYCWGINVQGQVGNGLFENERRTPTAVVGPS